MACLQRLADVACSTGVVDRGVWSRLAMQFLSWALVFGQGNMCFITTTRAFLKVLGNIFVMLRSRNSN